MAYFSNGTEGMMYEEQYCERCVHYIDRGAGSDSCPIWELHFHYNYDQSGKSKAAKAIKHFLDELIPTRADGFAGECNLFHPAEPKAEVADEYVEHLLEGKAPLEFDANRSLA
jgi:hypothetical protein